jgi:hypothetical protein
MNGLRLNVGVHTLTNGSLLFLLLLDIVTKWVSMFIILYNIINIIMSGLTGYLTTSGVDLSNVFMPINNNRFNNGLTVNNNITLPTTYAALPTPSQLGGRPTSSSSFTTTQFTSTTISNYNVGNITLPSGGVYFINISLKYTQTAAGNFTRAIIGLSLNGSDYILPITSQYVGTISMAVGNYNNYLINTIQSNISSRIIYVLCAFTITGTGTVTGSITYTRIA